MDVIPDAFALPGLDRTSQGLAFNTNRAVPVTVYLCPNCGRLKFMSALALGNLEAEQSEALTGGAQAPAEPKATFTPAE